MLKEAVFQYTGKEAAWHHIGMAFNCWLRHDCLFKQYVLAVHRVADADNIEWVDGFCISLPTTHEEDLDKLQRIMQQELSDVPTGGAVCGTINTAQFLHFIVDRSAEAEPHLSAAIEAGEAVFRRWVCFGRMQGHNDHVGGHEYLRVESVSWRERIEIDVRRQLTKGL